MFMIEVWKSSEPTQLTPMWLDVFSSQSTKADAPVILASAASVGSCLTKAKNDLWSPHREMY